MAQIQETVQKITKEGRKALKLAWCGAIIVAAGSARRMEGVDKIMLDFGGEPLIMRTVKEFALCDAIKEIVIVTRPDLVTELMHLCAGIPKVTAIVTGGETRQKSVEQGLAALSKKAKLVAVQDGARPFVTWQLIDRVVRAAGTYGAAVPGIPVKDTIKQTEGGIIRGTPDRKVLRAIQTPQAFDIDILKGALKKAAEDGIEITDDASAVEHMGMSVKLVEGDEKNFKITTPMDLKLAYLLLEEEK